MARVSLFTRYTQDGSSLLRGKGPFVDKAPEVYAGANKQSTTHAAVTGNGTTMDVNHSSFDLDGKEPKGYTANDANGPRGPF